MTSNAAPSISPAEAAFFGNLAADWWNPEGSSAMLHRITPIRSKLVRDAALARFGGDRGSRTPLVGRSAVDIGCGAGLMTEPMARMGAATVGIDAAAENIAAAIAHATGSGLSIDYRATSVEALATTGRQFDIVTCLEVMEHVADRDSFLQSLARLVAPGGVLVMSTPNRSAASWAVLIGGAEMLLRSIPRGAHDWRRFMTPEELTVGLAGVGLRILEQQGLTWRPGQGFVLGPDVSVNYFLTAVHQ